MPMNTNTFRHASARERQQGVALIVALIFLVVLTIIGIGVVSTTRSEEIMARNFRDMDVGLAAAEAALRDGELRVTGYWSNPAKPAQFYVDLDTCSAGLCVTSLGTSAPAPVYDRFAMDGSTGDPSALIGSAQTGHVNQSPSIANVSAQPRYLVEQLPMQRPGSSLTSGTAFVYRITSKGFGRGAAQVTLQELYSP